MKKLFLVCVVVPLALLWSVLGRLGVPRWTSTRLFPLLLLLCCLGANAQAAPPRTIYVTNYQYVFQTNYMYFFQTNYMFFNQTNWVYETKIMLQTNYVFATNYQTLTTFVFVTNPPAPPLDLRPWYYLTNQPLNLTNLTLTGTLTLSNATPGSVQTLNGTTVTGHLP
jgi:hypothetical protein